MEFKMSLMINYSSPLFCNSWRKLGFCSDPPIHQSKGSPFVEATTYQSFQIANIMTNYVSWLQHGGHSQPVNLVHSVQDPKPASWYVGYHQSISINSVYCHLVYSTDYWLALRTNRFHHVQYPISALQVIDFMYLLNCPNSAPSRRELFWIFF